MERYVGQGPEQRHVCPRDLGRAPRHVKVFWFLGMEALYPSLFSFHGSFITETRLIRLLATEEFVKMFYLLILERGRQREGEKRLISCPLTHAFIGWLLNVP